MGETEAENAEAGIEGSADEVAPAALPDQHDFYKMPAKFGHVPVAEEPLGWDPKSRFEHLYPHVRLPLQVVERFDFGSPELEPNKLFFGDNLHIMRSLPSESIDLIYIDPPFFSQKNYNVLFGDQNELRSFKDIWEGGLNGFLAWLNARLYEMKRLLKPTGSIFVHLDWRAGHYVKVEMDKLFGYDRFLNEIVWRYRTSGGAPKKWLHRNHHTIFRYGRGLVEDVIWNHPQEAWPEATLKKWQTDDEGRIYRVQNKFGKRYYIDPEGKLMDDVWEITLSSRTHERIGYPTQKPEALLERIIRAGSNEGGVVADFFCGGGTTPTVAQKLGRRWIASDISRVAVSITADRVAKAVEQDQADSKAAGVSIAIPDFEVAHWGIYEIAGLAQMSEDQFHDFVLNAYEARVDSTASLIHGYKGVEPIHVGPPDPDRAIRRDDVAEFANAVLARRGSGGSGTMIAWAFTDSARKMAERIAAQAKVKLQFVRLRLIPLESPEFAAHVTSRHERYSDLVAFVLPPSIRLRTTPLGGRRYRFDASESIALNTGAKIVNTQWDFDYRDYFTSTQGFELPRTKKGEPVLSAEYEFPAPGDFDIAVRVQDDLGGEAILYETISVA